MEFSDAIKSLGADPDHVEDAARSALDEQGFHVFHTILDGAHAEAMRDAWGADGSGVVELGGNRQLTELGPTHRCVVAALTAPTVLSSVMHLLRGPFALRTAAWREPRKGLGQQGLHADWPAPAPYGHHEVVTILYLLDDYTRDNGATRVVPGSHRQNRVVPKRFADPEAHHPGETLVDARAGDLLLFSGHLWHSGTRSHSGARRRVLQATFGRRGPEGFRAPLLSSEIPVSEAERVVLGLEHARDTGRE